MSSGTERSAKQAQKKEKPFDFSLVVDQNLEPFGRHQKG